MAILDSVSLFDSLSSNERNTLSLFCQERLLRSGEILFNEWDDATALYIIKSGSMKAYRDRSDGEVLVGYIWTNELVGEMALFDPAAPKKRMASVLAIDDTILLVIMDHAILELSKKDHEIYNKIAHIIVQRKKLSIP